MLFPLFFARVTSLECFFGVLRMCIARCERVGLTTGIGVWIGVWVMAFNVEGVAYAIQKVWHHSETRSN